MGLSNPFGLVQNDKISKAILKPLKIIHMRHLYMIIIIYFSFSLHAQTYIKAGIGIGTIKQHSFIGNEISKKLYLIKDFSQTSNLQLGIGHVNENSIREINFNFKFTQPSLPYALHDSNFIVTIGTVKDAHYELQGVVGRKYTNPSKPRIAYYAALYNGFIYQSTSYIAKDPIYYDMNSQTFGFHFGFLPKIQFNINKKFFTDVSSSINLVSLTKQSSENKNPLLTPNQQKSQVIEFDVNLETILQISLGYKF
jgi:hypothetical protein